MAVDLMRKHFIIATKCCYRSASRHPFLVVVVFASIWLYRSFPLLFYLLVYSSPVIASTLFLLGTLLFYGHENALELQKEGRPHHHKIHNLEIGGMRRIETDDPKHRRLIDNGVSRGNRKPFLVKRYVTEKGKMNSGDGSRRSSVDTLRNTRGHIDEDNKGWETGSDLHESSSPSASMVDIYSMLDELRPNSESEVPFPLVSTDAATDQSLESGEFVNDTDDDDDDDDDQEDLEVKDDEERSGITWIEDDQRNLMNLGRSELERNQILENLIMRQKALKNMRMQAEKKMESISPDLQFNVTNISTSRKNHFDHPYHFYDNNLGFAHPVMIPRRNPFDLPRDPSGQKFDGVGPTFQSDSSVAFRKNEPFGRRHEIFGSGPSTLGSYPTHERVASARKSTGSFHIPDMTEYTIQRRRFSEDNRTVKLQPDAQGDDRMNEVNVNDGNIGIQKEISYFHHEPSGQKSGQVGHTFQSDFSLAFRENEPLGHRHEIFGSGPSTLGSYPIPERIASARKSTGSFHIPDMSEYTIQTRRFSEDNRTVKLHPDAQGDNRMNEVNINDGSIGIQKENSCFHHDPSRQKSDRVGLTFQSDSSVAFRKNEPLGRRHEIFGSGPSTLGSYPTPERIASARKSTGSFHIPDMSEYTIQRRRFSEDNRTVKLHPDAQGDDMMNEVNVHDGNTGYKEKTFTKSTSSYYDVPDDISNEDDDNEEAEYRSPVAQDSKEQEMDNPTVDYSATIGNAEGGLPQGSSEVQQGLKSWLTGWKE